MNSNESVPRLAAIVVAAGQGVRMGAALPKAFLPLAGEAMLLHSLRTFAGLAATRQVLLVVAAERLQQARELVGDVGPVAVEVVVGGAERQDSVGNGLARVGEVELVAVHDAARPFVRAADIEACARVAAQMGAALLAVPARDTIKVADAARRVLATPERSTIWQAQTPQIFQLELLRRAHAQARAEGYLGTDDAALVERLGAPVELVEGDSDNRKLTTAADLAWAEWKMGNGRGQVDK